MVHSLTVTSTVFGNSFVVLDSAHDDFSFLDKLNPRVVSLSEEEGRINGWKYDDSRTKAEFTLEQLLHAPYMPLAGSMWGTSPCSHSPASLNSKPIPPKGGASSQFLTLSECPAIYQSRLGAIPQRRS
jgi:hypothetical protein